MSVKTYLQVSRFLSNLVGGNNQLVNQANQIGPILTKFQGLNAAQRTALGAALPPDVTMAQVDALVASLKTAVDAIQANLSLISGDL